MVYNIEGVSNNFSTQLGANGRGSIHVSSSNSKDPSTGRFTGNSFTLYRDNLIEGALPFMNNRERNCFPFAYWKVPFAFWKVPRFLEGSALFGRSSENGEYIDLYQTDRASAS